MTQQAIAPYTHEEIEDKISAIGLDCITCDSCGARAPQHRCSVCRTAFYCSATCEKNHQSEHSPFCISLEEMKQRQDTYVAKTYSPPSSESLSVEEAYNQECGICLDEQMKNPVVLVECKHAFCSSCLLQWQKRTRDVFPSNLEAVSAKESCPICRTETESSVEKDIIYKAFLLAVRAYEGSRKMSDDQLKEIRTEALDHIERLLSVENVNPQALFQKAEILIYLQEPQQALDTLDSMLKIDQKNDEYKSRMNDLFLQCDAAEAAGDVAEVERIQAMVTEIAEREGLPGPQLEHTEIYLLQAKAHEDMKQWEEAAEKYRTLLMDPDANQNLSAISQRKIFMGFAKCFYYMGLYDKSIGASDASIEMNRHFPGVHKYKALSLKKQGDVDGAINVIAQAAIYETPWDDDNQSEVLRLHEELKQLDATAGSLNGDDITL